MDFCKTSAVRKGMGAASAEDTPALLRLERFPASILREQGLCCIQQSQVKCLRTPTPSRSGKKVKSHFHVLERRVDISNIMYFVIKLVSGCGAGVEVPSV
jgi:hypothetical protein